MLFPAIYEHFKSVKDPVQSEHEVLTFVFPGLLPVPLKSSRTSG